MRHFMFGYLKASGAMAMVAATIAVSSAPLSAQRGAPRDSVRRTLPLIPRQYEPREFTLWAAVGGGAAINGKYAHIGGQLGVKGWVIDYRFVLSNRSQEPYSQRERYAAYHAVLVGHTLNATRSLSISAGLHTSEAWELTPSSCPCWDGGSGQDDPIVTTGGGIGLAAVAHAHLGTPVDFLTAGVDLTVLVGRVSNIGIALGLGVGRF
jgi:hypothetical protein